MLTTIEQQAVDLYLSGVPARQVARQIKRSGTFVRDAINKAGVPMRSLKRLAQTNWDRPWFTEGDKTIRPKGKGGSFRKYSIDDAALDVLRPDTAYVVGYFAADGCMFAGQPGGFSFGTCDKGMMEKIRDVFRATYPVKAVEKKNSDRLFYVLTMTSRPICEQLLKIGLTPRKSLTLQLPIIPDNLFFHFLRGYFDGDGTVRNPSTGRLSIGWASGSRLILEQVSNKVSELLGVQGGDIVHLGRKDEIAWSLNYRGQTALVISDAMYVDATDLFLARKRERIEHYRKHRKYYHRPNWMKAFATEKRCPGCTLTKPLADFSPDTKRVDGLHEYCRPCTAARLRNERHARGDGFNAWQREYRRRNRDVLLAKRRENRKRKKLESLHLTS